MFLAPRHATPRACFVCAYATVLHQGMERIKGVKRVLRCASKAPQQRSSLDVATIAAETQGIALLTQTRGALESPSCTATCATC
jgi:hypothetical protein